MRSTARLVALSLALAAPAVATPTILAEVPATLRVSPSGKPLTDAETAQLLDGKVVVGYRPDDRSDVREAAAVAIVDAGPDAVLRALHAQVRATERREPRITDDKRKVDGREVIVSSVDWLGGAPLPRAWTLVPLLAGVKTFVVHVGRTDPAALRDAVEAVRRRCARP